uniref:CSON012247 protein n=1 Tax=Culicoides sonorensis TaxID=179676 RepID=A0A336MH02_CULSO
MIKYFLLIFVLNLTLLTVSVNGTIINCGGTSAHRTLTFSTPSKLPETCVYKFKPTTSRVCKIKFEFIKFSLAQPSLVPFPKCVVDEMHSDEISLCGENAGQHVYLTYPSSKVLTLTFRTQDRTGINLPFPIWNIKMTQIDCNTNDITVPPPLCLQYFSAPNGVIESFNFNDGTGQYIGNTTYAICIRKPQRDSVIRFTSSLFEMSYNGEDPQIGTDTACLPALSNPDLSEDHLSIPGSAFLNGIRAEKFCGKSLLASRITSKTPGPFAMYFNSDQLFDALKPETGFTIFYEIV